MAWVLALALPVASLADARAQTGAAPAGPAPTGTAQADTTPVDTTQVRAEITGLPAFETLGLAEGLRSGTVWQVYFDRHGFVWLAGNNGVHRFDGRSVITFDRDPDRPSTLASRHNVAIAESSDALWAVSSTGVLQRLGVGSGQFERVPVQTLADGRLPSRVQQMIADASDRLWLVTDLGLLRHDTRSQTSRLVAIPVAASNRITRIAFHRGRILVATSAGDLFQVDPDFPEQPHALLDGPLAGGSPIWGLALDGDAVWLGSEFRLFRLEPDSGTPREYTPQHRLRQPDRMTVDGEGRLWLASSTDEGMVRFEPRTGRSDLFRPDSMDPLGLLSNRVLSLAVDPRGDLWVGLLRGGSQRLRLSEPGMDRFRAGHAGSQSFCAMSPLDATRLLVSLCGAGLGELDLASGGWTDLTPRIARHLASGAETLTAHALLRDAGGALWIPTTREGLLRWDPDRDQMTVLPLLAPDGSVVPSPYLTHIFEDAAGRIWVGSSYGLARVDDARTRLQQVGPLRLREGSYGGGINDVAQAPEGRLWLASNAGLLLYDPDTGQTQSLRHDPLDRQSLSDDRVLVLAHDPAGELWAGTQAGLNRLQGDPARARFVRYGLADGLPDQTIDAIIHDRQGRLWVGTDHGLAWLDAGRDRFQARTLPQVSPGTSVNKGAALAGMDGSLFFGTFAGLWRVDPATQRVTDPQPLLLSRYSVGEAERFNFRGADLAPITTRHDASRLGFSVAALGRSPRVSYRLSGLDEDWRELGAATSIDYPPLPRGRYQFEVRQAGADGIWLAPEIIVPVRVLPPPWLGPWAMASYALVAALALLLLAAALRDRRTRKRQHLRELNERDQRLMLALWASQDAMLELDLGSREMVHLGDRFLGYPCRALPVRLEGYLEMVHPDDTDAVERHLLRLGEGLGSTGDIEYRVRAADRDWTWVRFRGRLVGEAEAGSGTRRLSGMVSDISAERRAREQLRRLASYDGLTGLPNRVRFQEEMARRLERAPDAPLALLFIDLDRFKNINDSLGHQFGDRVLVAAAGRLARALPSEAYIARLGGDEFTAILSGAGDAASVARNLLDAFAEPLAVEGAEVVVSLSIGISLHPQHARDPSLLLQYADSAMYYAKDAGRNAWRFFHPDMVARVSRRLALETGLRRALAAGELSLVYQPRLDLADGSTCGAEALLRWNSAEHGQVPPNEFIPILEDTGMIEEVGLWVIEQACHQSLAWQAQGLPAIPISVNLSVHQLIHGGLGEDISQLLSGLGVRADQLELELTESALMQNAEHMRSTLAGLKALGLGLSIDDFGTGYSSFSYLSRLSVDTLKIDKSFIDGVGSSESADTLCGAMIAMAHNLRLRVVAEGVETQVQLEALRRMGCDEIQGFHYARPMPADAVAGFLRGGQGAD